MSALYADAPPWPHRIHDERKSAYRVEQHSGRENRYSDSSYRGRRMDAGDSLEPPGDADVATSERQGATKREWYRNQITTPRWATETDWLVRYGRALPLLMYIVRNMDWRSGRMGGYRHEAAAEHLQCARSTVAQQFRLLRESGKLTITARRQYDLDLQLANDCSEYQKITTLADYQKTDMQESATLSAPEYQKMRSRVARNAHSVLYVTNHTPSETQIQTDANASGAAEPAPVPLFEQPIDESRPIATGPIGKPSRKQGSKSSAEGTKPRAKSTTKRGVPKMTPEEQAYCVELLKQVHTLRNGHKLTEDERTKEWAAARRYYRYHQGQPASIDAIVDCYKGCLRMPNFATKRPYLCWITDQFDSYANQGAAEFHAGVERSRMGAHGEFDRRRQATRQTQREEPKQQRTRYVDRPDGKAWHVASTEQGGAQ